MLTKIEPLTETDLQPKNTGEDAPIYLSTGIEKLDNILSKDKASAEGGIFIGKGHQLNNLDTPIIVISGSSGTGKTTLAMQIAFNAARKDRITCFYSLEQTRLSLENAVNNFNEFEEVGSQNARLVKFCDLATITQMDHEIFSCAAEQEGSKKIHLCHFSPRPISDVQEQNVFEQRLTELRHITHKLCEENKKHNKLIVFFIDSLNTFSSNPLERNQIYRLFSLFRESHIPVIFTMEHPQTYHDGAELVYLECAVFLSDLAIKLSKDNSQGYLQYFLEIEKSRVGQQSLGRHLYKIRTEVDARFMQLDPRTGIVLYPSIHSVLSQARKIKPEDKIYKNLICGQENDDLHLIMQNEKIERGKCLSIIGPQGSHKLALGLNLSMSPLENGQTRLLIVNFGGSGTFDFKGVAWTENRKKCRQLDLKNDGANGQKVKFWCTEYTADSILTTILTFKIGQLTLEECFYIINVVITKGNYSSVLLSDTAELCNGFPLLITDPLFLPALIDLFEEYGLFTVCIGVDTQQPGVNTNINFALSSRADFRFVTSHYPERNDLCKNIVAGRPEKPKNEQFVNLVIDNVSGKHYGRAPIWIYVDHPFDPNEKVLHCSKDPPPMDIES